MIKDRIAHFDYDAIVERLVTAAQRHEDFLQDAIAASLEMTDDDTLRRFCYGDISSLIGSCYGEDRIGEYAKQVKKAASTMMEYRAVARFYPLEVRRQWLEEPALSWSHLRKAMYSGDANEANALLDEAASNSWSVEALSMEIKSRKGASVPPATLNALVTFRRVGDVLVCEGEGLEEIEEGVLMKVKMSKA